LCSTVASISGSGRIKNELWYLFWVYFSRPPSRTAIMIKSVELAFRSGPTTVQLEENLGSPFRRCRDHQSFDKVPIMDESVGPIERHYGGGTLLMRRT
jgi:hypothetical protein